MSGMARKRRDKGGRHDGGGGARSAHRAHAPATKKARATVTPQPATRVSQLALDDASGAEIQPPHVHEAESDEYEEEGAEYEDSAEQVEVEAEEEQEGDGEAADSGFPVVFQCGTCRSVFGDSYAFVGSNSELLLITLSAVTNVAQSPEVHTSHASADAGASFFELLCQNCQAVLGRKYLTTPVALDSIRDLYSFSTDDIASYQLGEPLQSANGLDADAQQAAAACSAAVNKLTADRHEVTRLREDMTKVQGLLLSVDERIARLEAVEHVDSEEEATEEVVEEEASSSGRRRGKREG